MPDEIRASWNKNALEWNALLERQGIASRRHTNRAIIDTIVGLGLKKVADIGCGEGWLCRALAENHIETVGFDATKSLLDIAKTKGSQTFVLSSFEDIINGNGLKGAPYDGAVFNFCIYQKDGLLLLFTQVLNNLKGNGVLLIQTLHPYYLLTHNLPYTSQWIPDAWQGLEGNFVEGHQWYARTLQDWSSLLSSFTNCTYEMLEVVNEEGHPISLIIILKKRT